MCRLSIVRAEFVYFLPVPRPREFEDIRTIADGSAESTVKREERSHSGFHWLEAS